jgi:hypothetical protein
MIMQQIIIQRSFSRASKALIFCNSFSASWEKKEQNCYDLRGACITTDGRREKCIGVDIKVIKQNIYIMNSTVGFALMPINNFETSKMERNFSKQYIQPGLFRKKITSTAAITKTS